MRHATSAAILIALALVSTQLGVRLSRPALSEGRPRADVFSNLDPNIKQPEPVETVARLRIARGFEKLPLRFEANQGQTNRRVQFLARGSGYGLYLRPAEAVLMLSKPNSVGNGDAGSGKSEAQLLRMKIVGGNHYSTVKGLDQLPGATNYLSGNDPNKWLTNVQAYQKVHYENIYPGADLVFYGNQQQLEYDFRLAPGADPKEIRLAFQGARRIRLDRFGDVVIETSAGDVRMHKPNVYQEHNDARELVAGKFVISRSGEIGFSIGKYDRSRLLVIDPTLSYSKVTLGNGANAGNGIAVDATGNAYIVGTTTSDNFPTKGPFQAARVGFKEVFVMKLDPTGGLVYSTYIAGGNDDIGRGIAIDSGGNAYITGWTFSTNFPTASPFQAARSTSPDAFLTKLNPSGSGLVYSTYLGGTGDDRAYSIALDAANDAYITGQTSSSNFPLANAFQSTRSGTADVFVTKLNPAGSALVYSTYFGGTQSLEIGNGIASDSDGNAYVVGQTASTNFPVMNAFQAGKGDPFTSFFSDAFVAKFNPTGVPLFSSYLGGGGDDVAYGVTLDSARNIYLTGTTNSSDFPTKNPLPTAGVNDYDAFVTELNAAGNALVYSTRVGGNADDTAYGIAVDSSSGKAAIIGKTSSPDFPAVRSLQSMGGGGVFQSSDAGNSWNYENSGLTSTVGFGSAGDVKALAIDPLDGSIYAGTGNGVFKSLDGVQPWTRLSESGAAYSILVEQQNSSIIYAGNFAGVSKSNDAGATWTTSSTGLPSDAVIDALAIDPNNDSIVYAATGISSTGPGVYKSIDGGTTWSAARTGLPNLAANTLLIDRSNPASLYVGVGFSGSTAGVYKSSNGGGAWTQVSTGLSNSGALALAFDPTSTTTIYAATFKGLYKTTNSGAGWTLLLETTFNLQSVAVDPQHPATILLGSEVLSGQGVLRSTDGGLNWSESGLTDNPVAALVIDPFTSTIHAACGSPVAADASTDTFVATLETGGSSLIFSSYLGGTGRDEGHGIGLDAAGNAYLTGLSYSKDYLAFSGASFSVKPEKDVEAAFLNKQFIPEPDLPEAGSIPIKDLSGSVVGRIAQGFGLACPPIRLRDLDSHLRGSEKTFYVGAYLIYGGTPPYRVARMEGHLPEGTQLSVNSVGQAVLFGVPTEVGSFPFTFTVVDALGCESFPGSFTVTIDPNPQPEIVVTKKQISYDSNLKQVSFEITATNQRSDTLRNVRVNDRPLGGAKVLSIQTTSPGWKIQLSNNQCDKASMAPGETLTATVVCDVSVLTESSFTNLATAEGEVLNLGGSHDHNAEGGVKATFTFPPIINSFSPTSGQSGTVVTISGQHFTGTTSVSINGTPVPFTVTNDSQIVLTVAANATTGPINVTGPGGTATSSSNFTVNTPCPTITLSINLPASLTVGTAFHQLGTISGGRKTYDLGVSSGSLPPGLLLGLSPDGDQFVLDGTPTQPGTYNFTLKATDRDGCTGVHSYTITIDCPQITITDNAFVNNNGPLPGVVGGRWSVLISGSGSTAASPGYQYTVTSGSLPPGVNLGTDQGSGSRGFLGIPTVAGTYTFTITATDSFGCTGSRTFTAQIKPAPVISSFMPASGPFGTPVTINGQFLTDVTGVSFNGITALFTIKGPTEIDTIVPNGATSGSIALIESIGDVLGTVTVTSTTNFTVSSPCPPITISILGGTTGDQTINATVGKSINKIIIPKGGTDPYEIELDFFSGALPPGLQLSSYANGAFAIEGTPTTPGSYSIPVIATDKNGCRGRATLTFVVTQPPPCSFTLSSSGASISADGGSRNVSIAASADDCGWTATSNDSWITLTSASSNAKKTIGRSSLTAHNSSALNGVGNGTVNYTVAANPSSLPRSGTMTIGGKTFTVTQAGAACAFTLTPQTKSFNASAAAGSVVVTATAPDCGWTAISNAPWITITSGSSGIGNGTVNYTVALNPESLDRSGTINIGGQMFTVNQVVPAWETVVLIASQVEIKTWTTGGTTYAYLKLLFPNAGYRVTNWGQATRVGNDFTADAAVEKFTGASVQSVTTTAQIYDLGQLANGTYNFSFKTSGVLAKTLQFTISSTVPPPNPIDNAREFVKQQYRDFLNREADQAGEDFWTDNITKCSDPARRPAGQTLEQCTLRQRETTSGAFFLSPEFQYTGYFVYRMYQGALGRQPKLSEFIQDAQFVGNGIIVNGQLSAAKINQNRADFAAQFANCSDATKYRCSEFKAIYDGLSNAQYVDKLFLTTGVNASAADRADLVNSIGASGTRASVLQKIVDGTVVLGEGNQQFTTTYGQAFYNSEFNRAFVELEYFGYMKRDPDDAGYGFWLSKLNQFGGNFVNAEMVLAFISSPEYRARFGQP